MLTSPVTVAIDAMGGDNAPGAAVAGALAAAVSLTDARLILVGDEACIQAHLPATVALPTNVSIHHAAQVIGMCDAPGTAIRQKRDSSIAVGMRLVRDGVAQAFVSAGNSGAMMAAAVLILKGQPGIDRPAIATLMPAKRGHFVLLDAGATADCKPLNLVQFAQLGNRYAATALQCASPRVGLLSIGEEPTKGNELTKETHELLRIHDDLNFIGNVEPKEALRGEVDVVVCDGFVGNLMLKAGEGFGEMLMDMIREQISRHWWSKLAGMLLKPALRGVKKKFDYAEIGGALLLGVNGIVVIGHGRSNAQAIESAARVAACAVRSGVVEPRAIVAKETTLA